MQQAVRYEVIYERHVAGLWQPALTLRPALIVEDDRAIRELLELHLTSAGFAVDAAADGSTALRLAAGAPFELVVLDVMLPGVDGVSICQRVRAGGPNATAAILMVTARDTEADKVPRPRERRRRLHRQAVRHPRAAGARDRGDAPARQGR